MKKLFTLLLSIAAATGAFAQEWHINANINNTMMLYENPFPAAGDPSTTNTIYHYGALIQAEKGLDLHNQWRLGLEAGFTGSLPIEITSVTQDPNFPLIPQVNASSTTLSWIPVRALVSYNSFEMRRKVNFRTSLAVGYAIGSGNYERLPTTILVGGVPVIVPGENTTLSWGGLTFAYRLGAQFTLKKDVTFLNLTLGYHGILSDYDGLFPSYDSEGVPSVDPILVNGVELNIGIVFRIWKYNQ